MQQHIPKHEAQIDTDQQLARMRHFTRRRALLWLPAAGSLMLTPAWALSLSDISNTDAIAGLKGALSSATANAVGSLGVMGGFWNNPKVKIPLPEYLEKASGILSAMGMKKQLDDLHEQINHAAEKAVVEAKPIFVNAVKAMSVQDAKSIISGGNDSGTQYFKGKTSGTLRDKFLPVVTSVTQRIGLAQKYNELAAKGSQFGLVKGDNAKVETYVTARSLDGLFTIMADEERAIRADPVKAGSDIVRKVFGALK